MKNKLLLFVLAVCLLGSATAAYAGTDEVTNTKLTRYTYNNSDAIGFYKMCADYSWLCMIWNNESETETHTIEFPKEGYITGWSGTKHSISDYSYQVKNYGDSIYLATNIPDNTKAFDGTLTLPPHSTYAVFFNVNELGKYNVYWDTDIFFKVRVDGSDERAFMGKLAQRGNACEDDKKVTAEILDGGYNSDGGDGSVSVKFRNTFPMTVYLTPETKLGYAGKDSSGTDISGVLENRITWNRTDVSLSTGSEATLTGAFTLPVEIAAVNPELDLTVYANFPSSLFFGNVEDTASLKMRGGVHGIFAGTYPADGSQGSFTGSVTNHLSEPIEVTLPAEGTVRAGSVSAPVSLTWDQSSPLTVAANSPAEVSGRISFESTDHALIAANNTLNYSVSYTSGGGEAFSAAGILTRDIEEDAVINSLAFCRDLSPAKDSVNFSYTLTNPSNIDIRLQLAGTLAVSGVVRNPAAVYTGCQSGETSCLDRISSDGMFTIRSGETVVFSGTAKPENAPDDDAVVSTSLVYYPDEVRKALYVGTAAASCISGEQLPGPAEPEIPGAKFDLTAQNGSYAACSSNPDVSFGWTITNTGMADGEFDLSDLAYLLNDERVDVRYVSCVRQSESGSDPTCSIPADKPILTVQPGVSLTVNLTYTPAEKISGRSISLQAVGADSLDGLSFEIPAYLTGTCEAKVEIEADAEDNPIHAVFDPDDPTRFTLEIRLSNTGSEKAVITPQTLYLHGSAMTNYSNCVGEYIDLSDTLAGKAVFPVEYDTSFDLPARTAVILSLPLSYDAESLTDQTESVNWTIAVNNSVLNANGEVSFPVWAAEGSGEGSDGEGSTTPEAQGSDTPESSLTPGTQGSTTPESRVTPVAPDRPDDRQGNLPEPPMNFVRLGNYEPMDQLPATGFSAVHPTALSVQPVELAYGMLDGLHLEIPGISRGADILSVPFSDGLLAVDWLGDAAAVPENGILPGEGTSIIAAHNHINNMSAGPFLFIRELENNDRIFVTDNSGKVLIFSVYRNELLAPDEGSLVYDHAIPGSLVLVTCEDEMPEGGYAYRRLVYAQPMQ